MENKQAKKHPLNHQATIMKNHCQASAMITADFMTNLQLSGHSGPGLSLELARRMPIVVTKILFGFKIVPVKQEIQRKCVKYVSCKLQT